MNAIIKMSLMTYNITSGYTSGELGMGTGAPYNIKYQYPMGKSIVS